MKNLNFLSRAFVVIVAMLSVGLSAFAYSFEAAGIYYITDETNKTVEVTSGATLYSGSVSIPSSVTYNGTTYSVTAIGYEAFEYCSGLTSITIPNSVIEIESGAFRGCSRLTSITISDYVTEIGRGAFYNTGWYNNQPDGILYLGNYCLGYKGDKPTGALTLKKDTRVIADYAFYSCSELTGALTIPNSVTSIGGDAFSGCSGLTSVTIPNSVTTIGSVAFRYCTRLTEVTIPNSVTEIGPETFEGCSGLTSVTIPNSVTTIGNYAFSSCYLESVTSYCITPPSCDHYAFSGSYDASLMVPEGTKDAYANADEWWKFSTIQEIAGVEDVMPDNYAVEIARYDIYGRLLTKPTKGINIVKMSDGSTKKLIIKK